MFKPIVGLISCTGVTGKWGLLSYAQNVVRWLTLPKRLVGALWRHLQIVKAVLCAYHIHTHSNFTKHS